jgi:hypothetical protein
MHCEEEWREVGEEEGLGKRSLDRFPRLHITL